MACTRSMGIAAVIAILAVVQPAAASFNVETGGALVVSPVKGRRRFDVALANFGQPRYGALLTGQLVYPTETGEYGTKVKCAPPGCNYGCRPFNESTPPLMLERQPGKRYIMLLDRGPRAAEEEGNPCYFLTKAWNAQMAGADALLVINDHDGDLSTAVAPDDENAARELDKLVISAGLISQADGNALKALLKGKDPVTVALNWTDLLPKSKKVSWEFWTNSNDECGAACDRQREFIKKFKPAGKLLQKKGLVDFQPRYLIWQCVTGSFQEDCESQCIRNGAYCCPDPDENIMEGYSGADVLKMNLRSLCFAKVARDRGEPWLWWDFVDRLGDDCPMSRKLYTPECAQKVFDAVAGANVGGKEGRDAWTKCIDIGPSTSKAPIPLLDAELKAQTGDDDSSTVAILPTIRIDGKQYRGTLEAGSVLRAICSGYPAGTEPTVCTETWVSEDECAEGGEGWLACHSGEHASAGRTRCINTFKGFSCECGKGYMRVVDKVTSEESCAELNQCLMSNVPFTQEGCKCDRCVCISTPGGFNCSGPIPDYCSPELDYAGCWRGTYGGKLYHACADNLRMYRYLAQSGRLNDTTKPFRCQCPSCFRATPKGGCEPACDLSRCDKNLGMCMPAAAAGGGSKVGAPFFGIFFGSLGAAGLTAGAMYAVYAFHVRRKLQEDVRSILEEYVPLASPPLSDPNDPGDQGSTPTSHAGSGNGNGSGGGGRRSSSASGLGIGGPLPSATPGLPVVGPPRPASVGGTSITINTPRPSAGV